MGDRASYAIRSKRVDVRYAHFGSPFLFADIFWGPDDARTFIESLEKGGWLDDVYGEAAAALCFRTKVAGIYTYQLDEVDASIAARLMHALWPGWQIRFGRRLTDITHVVGVDLAANAIRASLKNAPKRRAMERKGNALERLGARFRSEPYDLYFSFDGVLTIDATDRLVDVSLEQLLFEGPALLKHVANAPTLDEAHPVLRSMRYAWSRVPGEELTHGSCHASIDTQAKRLVVTVAANRLQEVERIASAHAIGVAWPGWTFEVQTGGLAAHFGARGVPAVLDTPRETPNVFARHTRKDVVASLRHIRTLLFGADEEKDKGAAFLANASAAIAQIVSDAGDAHVEIADGFSDDVTPKTALPLEERKRRYERAVREAGWTNEDAATPIAHDAPSESAASLVRTAYYAWARDNHDDAWTAIEKALALDATVANALAGRICYSLDHIDDAERFSKAALALHDDDAEAWATLGLVASKRGDVVEKLRCYRRAAELAPKPWIANNLACALLGQAEHATGSARRSLCEQALAASALSVERSSNLHWADACAYSMQEDAERAYACIKLARATDESRDRAARGQRMLDDTQLEFLWRVKGKKLPP